ncbi:hypothetical protein AX15_003698 [Amanita polypyramis BW_CC]|nr:hypothetical protein AX15_003698 [Amanita polypyramis BW_CC]
MARDDSEELKWARDELKATLAALEADLEALDESVKVVETTGPETFGLDHTEVLERRKYVNYVRKEVENMRASLFTHAHHPSQSQSQVPLPNSVKNKRPPQTSRPGSVVGSSAGSRTATPPSHYGEKDKPSYCPMSDLNPGAREDHQAAWALEEQQMMIRDQDQTMESIAGTLTTLVQQAGLMGQELAEHNESVFTIFLRVRF